MPQRRLSSPRTTFQIANIRSSRHISASSFRLWRMI